MHAVYVEHCMEEFVDGFICFSGKEYLKAIRNGHQEKGAKMLSTIINGLG